MITPEEQVRRLKAYMKLLQEQAVRAIYQRGKWAEPVSPRQEVIAAMLTLTMDQIPGGEDE